MGDSEWYREYGVDGDYQWPMAVAQTSDGGYIITGTRGYEIQDVLLMKTNAVGDTLWSRTYGGGEDYGESVQETRDKGYIVGGSIHFSGGYHAYLVRTDSNGDTLWTRTYEGSDFYSVLQTPDGGFIAAGTDGDAMLVRTDDRGNTLWTRHYGHTGMNAANSVQPTSDGGFILAGVERDTTISFWQNIYLIKTDANGSAEVKEAPGSPSRVSRRSARPDPFVFFTVLPGFEAERVTVSDISGRRVGTFKGDRIGEGLPPGVYFVRTGIDRAAPIMIVKLK